MVLCVYVYVCVFVCVESKDKYVLFYGSTAQIHLLRNQLVGYCHGPVCVYVYGV
jgi:hypothetical protein